MALAISQAPRPPTADVDVPALYARDVSKSFRGSKGKDVRAVDAVSLSVRRGEIYGLLGANGSGKSTLIRLFSTLLDPDSGEVRVFGHDVEHDEMAVKRLINRVSVEASISDYWYRFTGLDGAVIGMTTYGESAPAGDLYKHFGITADAVVAAVKGLA